MSDTVHGLEAPLPSPARQAARLVEIQRRHGNVNRGQAIVLAREGVAGDVAHPDPHPQLWAVEGFDRPLTDGQYHILVLAEIDRLATAHADEQATWERANGGGHDA